ncbi:MAG: GLPGLI family protein [Chitinophagaceae bacterium]
MKKLFIYVLLLVAYMPLQAQQIFAEKVSIEFDKTVAVKQLMKEIEPEWFEQIKSNLPNSLVSKFSFISDGTKSYYKRVKEPDIPRGMWFEPFADDNKVYNDYSAGTTVTQKPVFEETFLVQDSLQNIRWKITSDTRNIAGFECRKAVGIMYDTVAVFAFYTDEIMVSGGPEGIHGLPGMILGVGIPRLHTTWFATKVSLTPDLKQLAPASKGKKVDRAAMLSQMDRLLKQWDKYGQKLVLAFMI